MGLPFRRRFDALFRSDHATGWKMGAGALVGALIAYSASKDNVDAEGKADQGLMVVCVIATAVVGALAVLFLTFLDNQHRRSQANQQVNPFYRLCFGHGAISVVLSGVVLALMLVVGVIVLFGFMGL